MRTLRILYLSLYFPLASALFLFCASPSPAQTPTIVSGTITDSNGVAYSFAKVSAQLLPTTASPTIIVNGVPVQIGGQQNGSADVNGNFTMALFCNSAGGGCSVISPSGTQWQFTVNENGSPPPLGTGPQLCSATLTISGASQVISSSFSACPKLSNISGGGSGCTVAGATNALQKNNGAGGCAASAIVDNGTTATYSGAGGYVSPIFQSSAATAAATGVFRLANIEFIAWRNHVNTADFSIGTSGAGSGNVPTDQLSSAVSFFAAGFGNNSANVAASGFLRLLSSDTLSWRNNANTGDISLSKNTSDQLLFNGSVVVQGPASSTANDLAAFNSTTGTPLLDTGILSTNLVTAASNFTNGDLVQAAGNNKTTSDSGIVAANVVTAAASAGAANQMWQSGGANKAATANDFPETHRFIAANQSGGTAGNGFSLGTCVATARTGTNVIAGVLACGTSQTAYVQDEIPLDWNSGSNPFVRLLVTQGANATSGQTITFQIQGACGTTDDTAFATAQTLSTSTTVTTANTQFAQTVQLNATTMSGCAAGNIINLKILAGTAPAGGSPNVQMLDVTWPRRPVFQAN